MMKRRLLAGWAFALLAPLAPPASHAQVVRFEVLDSKPAFEGRIFGEAGPYLKITARATIAEDPADPRNAVIADIGVAPRNAAGKVEAVTDVVLLRPADPGRGNGTLLADVPNRGRKLAPQLFDEVSQPGATRAEKVDDAGLGFLERQGYTMVWVGWEADIASRPDQHALAAPVVGGVTGEVREEIVFDHMKSPASHKVPWLIADPSSLQVTVRAAWDAPRETPPGLSVRATGPQQIEITRPDSGFDAGALYEVRYVAKDPMVLGLGFAATRDVISFLRSSRTARNLLYQDGRLTVQRAIGFGASQSGRYLRDFLWLGFNEDLGGHQVFDGLMPHIAGARRMATNERFGDPNRNARHPQDPGWRGGTFPFSYVTLDDPLSGRRDGLMMRCRASRTCPRVMQTDSEHEWWAARASLLVTDTAGNHLDMPPDVRLYMLAGSPHFSDPAAVMKRSPIMSQPVNPLHAGAPMRALLTAMQSWLVDGVEPPSSRVPMRAHGTLVPAAAAVPRIPALPYAGTYTGAAFTDNSVFPARVLGTYSVFVPRADGDGMPIAGIHMLAVAVPKGSYTGWNPRAAGYGPGTIYPTIGSVVPFAATRAEREAAHDPRPSLAERYPSAQAYVDAVRSAAAEAVAERLLLPEDAARSIELAREDRLSKLH